MDDPYEFTEALGKETIDYAETQTEKFREKYGDASPELRKLVGDYYNTKRIIEVKTAKGHTLVTYLENGKYRLSLDGEDIHSTSNIISWTSCDDECSRIAFFETPGSDRGLVRIMSGKDVVEEIPGRISSVLFTDGSFYLVKTYIDEEPPDGGEINSHRVLRDGKIVFGTGLKSDDFITMHRFGNRIAVDVGDWKKSETYTGDVEDPSTWKKIRKSDCPAKTVAIEGEDAYFLEMRDNGVIKKGNDVLIASEKPIEDCLRVSGGFLVLHLDDAKIEPALYDLSGRLKKTFPLNEPMGMQSADSDGSTAAVILHSFGVAYSLNECNGEEFKAVEENRVMDLDVKEKWVKSTGADIHYFLMDRNGESDKILAYGYGGFNISMTPRFSPLFCALLDQGVAVAFTNLRGGGEYGENWHKAGTRENKQNVFDDFISVIETLRQNGSRVVAWGASNGGLLVSSIVTQRPDLLNGAVIGNPVIDMMRFHRMSVGRFWVSEYGDPDNVEDAAYLMKYSPYHNVRNLHYPKTLIYSRLNDDRVHPAHAIKFHMKMSEVNPDAYLRINPEGGHIGIAPSEMVSETSDIAGFVLNCLESEDQ